MQQSIATPAKSDTDQISHEQQTSGDMTAQPVAVDGSTLVYQANCKEGYYYEVFNSCVQGVGGAGAINPQRNRKHLFWVEGGC